MRPNITCPECGTPCGYWQVHCRCGAFLGFPNRRAAEAEQGALQARYADARNEADGRGLRLLLDKLEVLATNALPVICMPIAVCDDLLRPAKYRNYHQRIESGERAPAEAESHSDREMVGAKLYPAFHPHIQYAALSPDGRGLKNYGAVALRWQVTPFYLERRISLLDENSFTFFERYNLGALRTPIPPGHQSVWADRTKLTIAKLAARLNSATSESSLPMLLLHSAGNRDDDDFLEVAIYAEGGLDTKDVDLVSLQTSPTTPEDQRRWQLILEMCSARAIKVLS